MLFLTILINYYGMYYAYQLQQFYLLGAGADLLHYTPLGTV